jgi:site-specific recombinase XerC
MATVDSTDALVVMAESLGLTPADLVAAAGRLATPDLPTIAEYHEQVIDACPEKSLPTYGVNFRRLVATHGDRRLNEITTADLERLRDDTIATAATKKLAQAEASGRALRSHEHDAHGRGAGENAVRAHRFFFNTAKKNKLLQTNPASDVKVPKRPPAPERPLRVDELEEVAVIWCTTGNDPELDALIFEFHRKTAARREGGLNLRLGDLDARRPSITITEKFGKTREMPIDVDFINRLRSFARSRGATSPSHHIFRSKRGTKISRKRYETIYDRLDDHTSWTEKLDLGVHWIRHTTLDDVRTVAGNRVAATYAGHDDASQGTIGLYSKVTFEELEAAFHAIFGSP